MRPPLQPQKGKAAQPVRPAAAVTAARKAAFDILTLVLAGKGHSDELLHSTHIAGLSAEDRNLTTAIVMGVLRWQIALDARIAGLLTRPGQKVPPPVAIVLRMGAFQLLHMDRIPAHAALSESVELCRVAGQPQAAGMVNAILRKVAVSKPRTAPVFEPTSAFAQRLAHPQWLVDRWTGRYGRAAALAICEYDQQLPGSGGIFGIRSEHGDEEPSADSAEHLPQVDDGSRLVAELAAAAAPQGSPQTRIWDCCAAPGGKTLILAKRLPEAVLLATDISARRLQQMQRRFAGLGDAEKVRTAVMDAATAPASRPQSGGDAAFDLILCDVPCSGTGTLSRNPEIRHRLRLEDLPRQALRQRAILSNALCQLAPGGRLLYSTCSLEPEENEGVIEAAVPSGEYRRVAVEPLLASLVESDLLAASASDLLTSSAVRDGCLRTLPGIHPCDGFFAAVFERC
ncbi:MAG: hypothetical protein NVSMB62_11910 [Acidobacteriaceae bacterium]